MNNTREGVLVKYEDIDINSGMTTSYISTGNASWPFNISPITSLTEKNGNITNQFTVFSTNQVNSIYNYYYYNNNNCFLFFLDTFLFE